MAVALGETVIGTHLLRVEPIKFILLSSAVFLLAIAVMCFDRFYGSHGEHH